MASRQSKSHAHLYRNFFLVVLFVIVSCTTTVVLIHYLTERAGRRYLEPVTLTNVRNLPQVVIDDKVLLASPRIPWCSHWDCFNIYRCGQTGHDEISIYVYPLKKYVDPRGVPASEGITQEFYSILEAIIESKYYTADPRQACLFVPTIDTLSQNRFHSNITSQALNSLPFWKDGENHIIFNMLAGSPPEFSTVVDLNIGKALVAGAGFNSWTYRAGFDLSLPVFSPLAKQVEVNGGDALRPWLLVSAQMNLFPEDLDELRRLAAAHKEFLMLEWCSIPANFSERCVPNTRQRFQYPDLLQKAVFCLVARGTRLGQPILIEAMAAGCIPVILADNYVMPFQNVLDWKRAAVFIMEDNKKTVVDVLKSISNRHVVEMRNQVKWLYHKYFADMKRITNTALDIMQDRVFPQWAKSYEAWNLDPSLVLNTNPLFLPITAPKSQGFTAVVLTYDRVNSLFSLIEKLAQVPSLVKILVVWNNQKKSPPSQSLWPKINKSLRVIQTKANKLSNRFYPYEEIETEAILTIDDDIIMLTADELEFGYEVWREFPDRIVGYPSRTHVWDNVTLSWKYESEWTNEISMVLTGAAFLHKYWCYMYTTTMLPEVRDWVDENMNCEDIAMNFLVANVTNKPPIKVAPRKKFKCPECTSNEMLSADLSHMLERSQCVDRFSKAYGRMPLRSVEFRADPVLYKDNFPEKLKRFNDIGSL